MQGMPLRASDAANKSRHLARRLTRWLPLAALLIIYMGFLKWNFAPGIGAFDEHGYYAQGSLLATTGKTSLVLESRAEYVGQHWFPTSEGRYYSRHSPGLALAVALSMGLFGPAAGSALSFTINPILSLLGLLGVFLLARNILGHWWGLAAALLLAGGSTFCAHALAGDAHMLVTVLLVWGVYLLVLWRSSGRIIHAVAAGVLLGCIPVARAPEAICVVGIAPLLIVQRQALPRIWRHYLAAAAGAAIPVIPLLVYNQVSFGAFWRTAYSLTGEQSAFSLSNLKMHSAQYLLGLLGRDGLGVFFPLGLAGAVSMLARSGKRAFGLAILGVTAPTILLYMAYYWAPRGQASLLMRFLLPVFALLITSGLWFVSSVSKRVRFRARVTLVAILIGMHLLYEVPTSLARCRVMFNHKAISAAAAAGVEAAIPHGSVIMASPGILAHLDFLRRWRLANPALALAVPEATVTGEAADMSGPPDAGGKRRYWQIGPDGSCKAFRDDVMTWSGGAPVYFVGPEAQTKNTLEMLGYPPTFAVVSRIPMPALEPAPGFDPLAVLLRTLYKVTAGRTPTARPGVGRQGVGGVNADTRARGAPYSMEALVVVEIRDHNP
jgi:hypothetical protein